MRIVSRKHKKGIRLKEKTSFNLELESQLDMQVHPLDSSGGKNERRNKKIHHGL